MCLRLDRIGITALSSPSWLCAGGVVGSLASWAATLIVKGSSLCSSNRKRYSSQLVMPFVARISSLLKTK